MLKVAVTTAVDKNTKTAASDLNENLGNPHNPCPLVHPLDNYVPIPTNRPATIR